MHTAEQIIMKKGADVFFVSPDTTIHEALLIMSEHRVGAIMVKRGEDFVGIWTERDLVKNTIQRGFDARTDKIERYMTVELKYAEHDETVDQLEDKFLGMRLRHLLVRKEGKCIGILSAGDVMKTVMNEKEEELKKLHKMVSWEYHENWRWDKRE